MNRRKIGLESLTINKNQSYAIGCIRAISAIMIVLCHIFQGLGNELAWWFNVGVQIFFFMSGFLMAKNYIEKPNVFLKKRLIKILIPYYILLFITVGVYVLVGIEIDINMIVTYVLCLQGLTYKNIIPGLEHLWFISIILVCYVLTLGLNHLRKKLIEDKNKTFYIKLFAVLMIVQIVVSNSILPIAFGARIGAFIIGYFIACKFKYSSPKKMVNIFSILTLVTLCIRLYFTYISPITNLYLNKLFSEYFVNWQHTLLGCGIFIILYDILSKRETRKSLINKSMDIISKYSYEIYLTHQIFILGPLSVLFLSRYVSLNIILISILILIFSVLLYRISEYINKIIVKNAK